MNRRDLMIFEALKAQERKLEQIKRGTSWWLDLSANVVGNGIWDGALWVARKILRKL